MNLLAYLAIFFAAAVVAVPLSRRFGLGSVLGYLAAGVVLGPFGLGTFYGAENLLHYAEFGVVLLLFVIGLELNPQRLWTLRKSVFGLGFLQVATTGMTLAAIAYALGLAPAAALVIGFALALSSTALGLQTLAERRDLAEPYGRTGFGILLFQDLAVVPLLVAVPLLGARIAFEALSPTAVALAVGGVIAVFIGGRYLLNFVLRLAARAGLTEVMTLAALLVVAASAYATDAVGLSMGLGAFLAGVFMAESEFRHELEADIEPFKGILLGLFFFAIGMSIDLEVLRASPLAVLGLVAGLLAVKIVFLLSIGRLAGLDRRQTVRLAMLLCQGGEFAFVILTLAAGHALFRNETSALLILVVALSMAVTPLLLLAADRLFPAPPPPKPAKRHQRPEKGSEVVIAGFGRFGQIVARI
ncbi:MAG TPA: monovalent cation:proton antiporter-2 (CPA2) family protein, partial [Sphingomonadales bacterium]|nr:monovalent cation:proton antiporter-2 (CPA2) family protein [Sphingomonadales bacterium]